MTNVEKCNGRGCDLPSVGKIEEFACVPAWRQSADRSLIFREYEVLSVVHYCERHEKDASHFRIAVTEHWQNDARPSHPTLL